MPSYIEGLAEEISKKSLGGIKVNPTLCYVIAAVVAVCDVLISDKGG